MRRLLTVLAVLLVAVFIISGCSTNSPNNPPASNTSAATTTAPTTSSTTQASSAQSTTKPSTAAPVAGEPKYGGTLRIAFENSPAGAIGWPPDILGDSNVPTQICLEPFLRETVKGELIPWLAESYKVADDLKSITFNLRKGVKFHDGSDFNAEVAKWNLDNMINAKREPYWKSVEIVGDYSIKINFTEWRNTILEAFADNQDSWMVSKAAFDKNGIDWMRQNPVGTGAFKFVSFSRDVGFKTAKFLDYWGKDAKGNKLPYLDALEFTFVADNMTQLNVMQSGKADIANTEPGKRAADMAAAGLVLKVALVGSTCLIPDSANADSPYANQKVREAVEYAIDREAIAKGLGYGYWKAPYQIPPPAATIYNSNFNLGRQYSVEKAKQLLAEANLSGGFKTTLISAPAGRNKDICVALQGYLGKVGIDAEIQYPDQPTFQKIQTSPIKNAMIIQGLPSYPNYNLAIQTFLDPKSIRFPSWIRSPEFTQLYNTSQAAPKADIKLMQAYMDQLTKECAIIPVYSSGRSWVVTSAVMNDGFTERGQTLFFNPEQTWLK
jgi:peptide/nickel transport system substrate-binding protein